MEKIFYLINVLLDYQHRFATIGNLVPLKIEKSLPSKEQAK